MGIRSKLIPLLLAIAMVPMLAIGTMTYFQTRDALTKSTLTNLEALATIQENRLTDFAETQKRRLNFVNVGTDLPAAVVSGNRTQLETSIQELQKNLSDVTTVSVQNLQGITLASTDPAEVGLNRSTQVDFQGALKQRIRPSVTQQADRRLTVQVSGIITSAGAPVGVLTTTSPGTILETLSVEYTGLGSTGEYRVVARNQAGEGAVALSALRFEPTAEIGSRVESTRPNSLIDRALQQQEQTFTDLTDYRGVAVLAATRYVEALDWGLIAKIDKSEAYQSAHAVRNVIVLLGAVLTLLLILVVTEISYSITRPLVRLTGLTQRLGQGNLQERAAVQSNDEIGRLGASINAMAERLAESQSTLKKRVSDLSQSRQKIRHQSTHDALTGLPNRAQFVESLQEALEKAQKRKTKTGVLTMDLDRFKAINDSLGHTIGDKLLQELSGRLSKVTRGEELLARFGGDEFAVLMPVLKRPSDPSRLANRILKSLREPFKFDGYELYVDTSIGIAVGPKNGTTPEQLLRNSDIALYRAKDKGNDYEHFDLAMGVGATERLSLENDLRKAFERDEFVLHYQLIAAPGGALVGAEALIRWQHPQHGLLYPDQFIPHIEAIGLSDAMGTWTIWQACRDLKSWIAAGHQLTVSVNLSSRQFSHVDLVRTVKKTLRKTGVDPTLLEIEITESAAMLQFDEARQKIADLKKLGISIALDDFGTGHSSLSQISRLPIDKLKIDQSFVSNADKSPQDLALIKTIISIGESLGLAVVVEGVETAEQMRLVTSLGCDAVQGFHVGRPVRAEIFQETLEGLNGLAHAST